jgi:hypothetical protein
MKKIPNWKTSTCGVVAAIAGAITPALSARWQPVALAVATLATSLGLALASDAGKSGTAVPDNASKADPAAEAPSDPLVTADAHEGNHDNGQQ